MSFALFRSVVQQPCTPSATCLHHPSEKRKFQKQGMRVLSWNKEQ